jgi:hypothetical protein
METSKYIANYRVSTQKQGASGLGLEAQQEIVAHYLGGGASELVGEFIETETGKVPTRWRRGRSFAWRWKPAESRARSC